MDQEPDPTVPGEAPDPADDTDTARLADLPVQGVPPDAPDAAMAAVDDAAVPGDPRGVMAAYSRALAAADAAAVAALFAEHSLLVAPDRRCSGRDAIGGWHRELLAGGKLDARPGGQGNDQGRLEVRGPSGAFWVVELAFDAAGRIGTARWLTPEQAGRPQDERERHAI